ncbi:hypothetical protein Q1695_004166 [Nippostrongylus brasiliensis]|nr:hypothetical protein Q1695_004166 [Nippostrongylus brasiliensis]
MLYIARVFVLFVGLNSPIYGNVGNSSCMCPSSETGRRNCYRIESPFLSLYTIQGESSLQECGEQCINPKISLSLADEKVKYQFVLKRQCYVTRCPCICESFCERNPDKFETVDCPREDDAYFAHCSAATTQVEQHSSPPSETSTGTSQSQSTMEDHPTSDNEVNDFGSSSSRATTIHTNPMPSASTPVSTHAETSLKKEVTDKSTSITIKTSQETETTGTTATTTTVYGTTEEPLQTRLTTSTVGTEPSTNEARSTSEPDLSSISESTTSSTLGSTTDSIRTSGTTLPASSSHATTDSTSWSSILIGKWTTTHGSETITSSSVYEKPSKTTTTVGDWSTKAPTTTMTTTEASTSFTLFEKTSHTSTKSQLEESTYTTSAYKTTTLQDLETSSRKASTETVSSSHTYVPNQEKPSTTIQDSTHKTSTSSDLQASSEASSGPATAPVYTATSSHGMRNSPTAKLEESTYRTSPYPIQQESSGKASTATSAPSLFTTILSQGRGTSTTQLQETTTIDQGPQTSPEKASSGPVILQTHTAIPTQRTSTTTLPDDSTSFSTSDTASLKTGEGPESTTKKRPIISSRITRYYQPSSSSTIPVSEQTTSSTEAPLPYRTTIDKSSSVTSTSYAEVYSPHTLLSTLLHRGDGTTLTAMDEDAQETSSTPISEKAFHLCAVEEKGDMADEVDLRDGLVQQLLRNASRNNEDVQRFFVNERDSKQYMEEKKVRVVSLERSSRFLLYVNETVGPRSYVNNVTAACKRPKYCGDFYCNLNDFEFFGTDTNLVIPDDLNRTMAVGESVTIRCTKSDTEVVKVSCRQKGYLNPHPTRIACQEDRKLALLKKMRIRKSCKECFRYGTEKCVKVSGGFTCQCRTNWTEPTCWRAPDLCRINQVDCGENGRCVTELTKTRCICNSTFAGPNCAVNKTRLSFISETEASFVSGTTAGASILVATGSIVLLVRGLLAFVYRGTSNDPQSYYQNLRCFFVSLAGLLSFFFRHPALLGISQIQCTVTAVMTTCCFTFGMAFFALEALTFYECASLRQLNSWTEPFWGRKRWYTSPAFRTLTPLLILAAAVIGAFKSNPKEAASSWSCLGRFEPATRDFWFPIALAHSCLGLAALAFTLEGRFKIKNMPQFQLVVEEHLKPLPPSRRDEVEKCQRNHGLTAIAPWLLYTTWLFIAISADWVVTPVNSWAVACSLGYSACELAIFILTTPQVYSAVTRTWMRLLPQCLSPAVDPVSLWSREEVKHRLQRRRQRNGRRRRRFGRKCPASKAFVPLKYCKRLKKKWTALYKKLREKNEKKTKAQVIWKIYRMKLQEDLEHMRTKSCRKRIRQLFCGWARTTYREDTQPDPVLKLKTRVDMYLEERAVLMEDLVFLGGGEGDRGGLRYEAEKRAEKEHYVPPEFCIPMCYASVVDSYGYTQLEEVMKTPADEALNLCQPSTSRQQEQVDDGGERSICEFRFMIGTKSKFFLLLSAVNTLISIGNAQNSTEECKCSVSDSTTESKCYRPRTYWLDDYMASGIQLRGCERQCFRREVVDFFEKENPIGMRQRCYVMKCPCLCEEKCEALIGRSLDTIDCPLPMDQTVVSCSNESWSSLPATPGKSSSTAKITSDSTIGTTAAYPGSNSTGIEPSPTPTTALAEEITSAIAQTQSVQSECKCRNQNEATEDTCYRPTPRWLTKYRIGMYLRSCPRDCNDSESQAFFISEESKWNDPSAQCYVMKCPCFCKDVCEEQVNDGYLVKTPCPPGMARNVDYCDRSSTTLTLSSTTLALSSTRVTSSAATIREPGEGTASLEATHETEEGTTFIGTTQKAEEGITSLETIQGARETAASSDISQEAEERTTSLRTTQEAGEGTTYLETTQERREEYTSSGTIQEADEVTTPSWITTTPEQTTSYVTSIASERTTESSPPQQTPPTTLPAMKINCTLPCPRGYLEGPDYCYRLLNDTTTTNYRTALHLCTLDGFSDMADEVDLRNPVVLQLLRNAR